MFLRKREGGWKRVIFLGICQPKDKVVQKEKLVKWVTHEADLAKKEGKKISRIWRFSQALTSQGFFKVA